MCTNPIRVFVVEADTEDRQNLSARLQQADGIEVAGAARDPETARKRVDALQPDVLLVDLALPGEGAVEIIGDCADRHPPLPVLILTPRDPSHDRLLLALEAGALGYVDKEAAADELMMAVHQVQQGEPWLPPHMTYELLQEAAGELEISGQERRERLKSIILGLVPIGGALTAVMAYLWREYWDQLGVRVIDLGIEPVDRVVDALKVGLLLLGVFGPLLLVEVWRRDTAAWLRRSKSWSTRLDRLQALHLDRVPVGRVAFHRRVAWVILAILVFAVTVTLAVFGRLVLVLFVGPAIAFILLAEVLDLGDNLPSGLKMQSLKTGGVLILLGLVFFLFVLVLSVEITVIGPDLRTDGVHGLVAPWVLGIRAQPVWVIPDDKDKKPFGALHLGGAGGVYVFYDPCEREVEQFSNSDVELENREVVKCPQP
jgi:DNA-binding NarL/FixJ family response regulator